MSENLNAAKAGDNTVRFYRPELDWLRFMAFSMVFSLHAFPSDPDKYTILGLPAALAEYLIIPFAQAGGYGVDLFFALSAYLITELLLREKESTGQVHIRSFYLRRILRIWPLYIVFILVAIPIDRISWDIPISYYISLLAFTGNWYIVVFGGFPSLCGNLWSVCIEEQFYITWPVLVGRVKTKRFAAILFGIFTFSFLYRILYVHGSPPFPIAVWYNTFTRLDGFALGGLLACAMHGRTVILPFAVRASIFVAAAAAFWGIGHAPIGGYFGEDPVWTYPLAAVGSALLILVFITSPGRTSLNGPLRFLSYLGKISYGLYVFHGPALRFTHFTMEDSGVSNNLSWVIGVAISAVLTLAISMLSYAVLEKPFLRLKRRFTFVQSRPE